MSLFAAEAANNDMDVVVVDVCCEYHRIERDSSNRLPWLEPFHKNKGKNRVIS